MLLVQAVVAGFLAGQIRAWYGERRLSVPDLRWACLVLLAFIPQWLAFFLPASRNLVPDRLAPAVLVGSQALLLLFAWLPTPADEVIWVQKIIDAIYASSKANREIRLK